MTDPLERIAAALDRLAPPPLALPDFRHGAYIWQSAPEGLLPVEAVSAVSLDQLRGIDRARDVLLANTRAFADGLAANNALLWGARGMGKSSLVKAVHQALRPDHPSLILVEVLRDDLATLPMCLALLRGRPERFVLFCDDLSFEQDEGAYKALKSVLDGGIAGRPENVVFYATSNRRHLLSRDMIENERSSAINPGEAVEEKVSLSDRFGLWLGFHACDQEAYLEMAFAYARAFGVTLPEAELRAEAIEWQATRGARSGRVAVQFAQDLAARQAVSGGAVSGEAVLGEAGSGRAPAGRAASGKAGTLS